MNRLPIEPGRAVLSMAGRDAGRRFVALRVDETYAYVADGDLRKVETPKKKKRRHIQIISRTVDITGADDAKIRRELRAAGREEGKSYLTQQ